MRCCKDATADCEFVNRCELDFCIKMFVHS